MKEEILAFPGPVILRKNDRYKYTDPGMSLRDYFAAKAMEGLLSGDAPGSGEIPKGLSDLAYEIADAMMEAREN